MRQRGKGPAAASQPHTKGQRQNADRRDPQDPTDDEIAQYLGYKMNISLLDLVMNMIQKTIFQIDKSKICLDL